MHGSRQDSRSTNITSKAVNYLSAFKSNSVTRFHSFFIICFSLSLGHTAFSQIANGPEIGISAFPFEVYGRSLHRMKNISPSYGVFGILPLSKSVNVKLSVSYNDRKDLCLDNGTVVPENSKTFYRSNDLNMDLSCSYKFKERLFAGIGVSSVYKLNSWAGRGSVCDPDSIRNIGDMSHMQYALNASIEYHWKHILVSFVYARFLRVEYLGFFGLSGKDGLNRYDLRVAYPIRFKSRNGN